MGRERAPSPEVKPVVKAEIARTGRRQFPNRPAMKISPSSTTWLMLSGLGMITGASRSTEIVLRRPSDRWLRQTAAPVIAPKTPAQVTRATADQAGKKAMRKRHRLKGSQPLKVGPPEGPLMVIMLKPDLSSRR